MNSYKLFTVITREQLFLNFPELMRTEFYLLIARQNFNLKILYVLSERTPSNFYALKNNYEAMKFHLKYASSSAEFL